MLVGLFIVLFTPARVSLVDKLFVSSCLILLFLSKIALGVVKKQQHYFNHIKILYFTFGGTKKNAY